MAVTQQILASLSGSAPVAPIAFVQANQSTTADGSAGLTVSPGSRTNGNTVFAAITYDRAAVLTGAVTFGGQDMVVAAQNQDDGSNLFIELWHRYLDGTESDNNCTYTTDSAVRANLCAMEFSGIPNVAPEDYEDARRGPSDTLAMVTSALAPTSANNIIIAVGGYADASNQYSSGPTNGFTQLTAVGGATIRQETIYLIRSASNASISSDIVLTGSYSWGTVSGAWGGN